MSSSTTQASQASRFTADLFTPETIEEQREKARAQLIEVLNELPHKDTPPAGLDDWHHALDVALVSKALS